VALVLVSLVVGLSVEVTVSDPSRAENMETVLTEASERLLEVELST
jgi:hypothetical protein